MLFRFLLQILEHPPANILRIKGESHAFMFLRSLNHVVGRKVRIDTSDWLYTQIFATSIVITGIVIIPVSSNIFCVLFISSGQIFLHIAFLNTSKIKIFFFFLHFALYIFLNYSIFNNHMIQNIKFLILFPSYTKMCKKIYRDRQISESKL